MRRWWPLLLLLFTALAACQRRYKAGNEQLLQRAKRPSWRELRQHPRRFDGDTILLEGRFHMRFEDVALYGPSLFANDRIWVEPFPAPMDSLSTAELDGLDQRSAQVLGVFDADNTAHLGQYGGTIEPILYIRFD